MDPSFPVVPADSGRSVDRRRTGKAPVHTAGEMGFDADSKLRQDWWQTIGERSRARLGELAGGVIDWYAYQFAGDPDGRAYAVVFGDRGLAIAEPRVNTEHRPVYAISAFVFTPGTLRHLRVDHRPPPGSAPPPGAAGPADPETAPDLGLQPNARGLLGNLPPQAQELLQAPFTGGQQVTRCDWYYDGTEQNLNTFVMYLAGPQDVTVATGSKVVPVGHTNATAHWALTCYRASVARRIGK